MISGRPWTAWKSSWLKTTQTVNAMAKWCRSECIAANYLRFRHRKIVTSLQLDAIYNNFNSRSREEKWTNSCKNGWISWAVSSMRFLVLLRAVNVLFIVRVRASSTARTETAIKWMLCAAAAFSCLQFSMRAAQLRLRVHIVDSELGERDSHLGVWLL